jgi:hypothetical protein
MRRAGGGGTRRNPPLLGAWGFGGSSFLFRNIKV